jgi:serine-type D-Ala-D-Ala carboxypeptidase (penicillin-binding protein 5/6)
MDLELTSKAQEEAAPRALEHPEHVDVLIQSDAIQHSTVPMVPQLIVATLLLAGLFLMSYIPWMKSRQGAPTEVETALRSALTEPEVLPARETAVREPTLEAKSAFVWDITHQRALYSHNASAQLPLASLTKLMTSLVALETLGGTSTVNMTLAAILQDGQSDFLDGEKMNAQSLSDFSLISSSNDGAYALAAAASSKLGDASSTNAFVAAMNRKAEELGLTQTYFSNPTGLDETFAQSGSYGSARDMAFLMEYLVTKESNVVLPSTALHAKIIGSVPHTASNTNEIVTKIPGLMGTKTGYTDLAGGNLVIAFNAGLNRPIAISVLGSTREGRFRDVQKLIRYAQRKVTETAP